MSNDESLPKPLSVEVEEVLNVDAVFGQSPKGKQQEEQKS